MDKYLKFYQWKLIEKKLKNGKKTTKYQYQWFKYLINIIWFWKFKWWWKIIKLN